MTKGFEGHPFEGQMKDAMRAFSFGVEATGSNSSATFGYGFATDDNRHIGSIAEVLVSLDEDLAYAVLTIDAEDGLVRSYVLIPPRPQFAPSTWADFDAVKWAIEQLNHDHPVWKVYQSGNVARVADEIMKTITGG
jgi:hypothetical protein